MRKYGREGFFFHLIYVEPKHQSDLHNQAGANDFQRLIWVFWVCQLSPTWYNFACSQLMSRFDCYQLQLVYPAMEHCPARNLQHDTSQTTFDTFDESQNLLHTLHHLFLGFSCVFTFLEIIKHTMSKLLLFFFHQYYKMATQKFTNFDKFFKKYTLIWQLSQYNLTKLFQMILKTTKRY